MGFVGSNVVVILKKMEWEKQLHILYDRYYFNTDCFIAPCRGVYKDNVVGSRTFNVRLIHSTVITALVTWEVCMNDHGMFVEEEVNIIT